MVRNRARRRLRETVRLEEGNLTPGWDIVVVARGRTLSEPFPRLRESYRKLCGQLHMLREDGK